MDVDLVEDVLEAVDQAPFSAALDEAAGRLEAEGDGADADQSLRAWFQSGGTSDGEVLSRKAKLARWFSLHNARDVDILESFGGLFFVHVESLVLHFGARRDLGDSFEDSAQFVRTIYYIEKLLQRLEHSGGRFVLIFFNGYREVFEQYSSVFWSLRNMFLLHCHLNPSKFAFKVFSGWLCPDYIAYLNVSRPSFMLLEDGSSSWNVLPATVDCAEDEKESSDEDEQPDEQCMLFALMLNCLHLGIGTASLYGLRIDSRKIYALAMLPDATTNKLYEICCGDIQFGNEEEKSDEAPFTIAEYNSIYESCKPVEQGTTSSDFIWKSGWRSVMVASFVKHEVMMLEGDENDEDRRRLEMLAKFLVIHDVYLQQLSLQERCHEAAKMEGDFFDDLFGSYVDYFLDITNKRIEQMLGKNCDLDQLLTNVDDHEVSDFLDLRFLRSVMALTASNAIESKTQTAKAEFFGISVENKTRIEAYWSTHTSGSSLVPSFFPIDLTFLMEGCETPTTEADQSTLSPHPPQLLPLECPLVRTVLRQKNDQSQFAFTGIENVNPEIVCPVFNSEIHVDYVRVFEDENDRGESTLNKRLESLKDKSYYKNKTKGMNAQDRDKYDQKLKKRWRLQKLNNLMKISRSLVGSDNLHHPIVLRPHGHPWLASEADIEQDQNTPPVKEGAVKMKMGAKKLAIIEKNKSAQKLKVLSREADSAKTLDRRCDQLQKKTDPAEFNSFLLDITAGLQRRVDSFGDFAAVAKILELPESQCQFLLTIVKTCELRQLAFKTVAFITGGKECVKHARKTICLIFRLVNDIYNTYGIHIDAKGIVVLQRALIACGFVESAKQLFMAWERKMLDNITAEAITAAAGGNKPVKAGKAAKEKGGSKKAKEKAEEDAKRKRAVAAKQFEQSLVKEPCNSEFRVVPGSEPEFQLRFMGADMERTTGSAKDEKNRVKFRPDGWQLRLLDIVDNQDSALVVAPTAAGKTFICFYAMDLVLRKDDESVVIFVAPTKALVNQVTHEINARFSSKTYKSGTAYTLQGSATGELCEDITTCQILVTVPELLEHFLLSADPAYRKWVRRLRYVIFDEVHCIGSSTKASKEMEHSLQMIPCPFLALSATVGNLQSFHKWLNRASLPDKERGRNVHVITHGERYSDLHLYNYDSDTNNVIPLHSITCMQYRQWVVRSVPDDFYLTTDETLQLQGCLSKLLIKNKDLIEEVGKREVGRLLSSEGVELVVSASALGGFKYSHHIRPNGTVAGPKDDETAEHDGKMIVLMQSLVKNMKADVAKAFIDAAGRISETEITFFLRELTPDRYLKYCRCVTKAQYRMYMTTVKHSFVRLLDCGVVSESLYEELVADLKQFCTDNSEENNCDRLMCRDLAKPLASNAGLKMDKLQQVFQQIAPPLSPVAAATTAAAPANLSSVPVAVRADGVVSQSYQDPSKLLKVIKSFDQKSLLPMIIFNFDNRQLDKMAKNLYEKFCKEQWEKYWGDEDKAHRTKTINKDRMARYKQLIKTREMSQKLKGMSREQREEQGLDGDVEREPVGDLPPEPRDIDEEIDPEFSLAKLDALGQHGEWITEQIESLTKLRDKGKLQDWQVEGLQRGIGVHHERLNTPYRHAVEILFRMGYLSVVFASGTLALGINMPCRTTLFAGDSLELTPLMFRQMAGRAGRRGHDTKGHVVFWDILPDKIDRLLSAQLPVLSGSFPSSSTLALRTSYLYHNLTDSEDMGLVRRGVSQFYTQPLCLVKDRDAEPTEDEQQRMFHLTTLNYRFSLEFLRRNGWLDESGTIMPYAQPILHIFDEEPGNFILVDLVRRGILQKICSKHEETLKKEDWNDNVKITKMRLEQAEELLPILASAVARVNLTPAIAMRGLEMELRHEKDKSLPRFGTHTPALPPLSAEVESVFDDYNRQVLRLQSECQTSFGLARPIHEDDCKLPMSKLQFRLESTSLNTTPSDTGFLVPSLARRKITSVSRSPFAALSGFADSVVPSAAELSLSIRVDSFLELGMIPTLAPPEFRIPKFKSSQATEASDGECDEKSRLRRMQNSYVLEFWRHGKFEALAHNGITGANQYFLLRQFLKSMNSLLYVLKKCYLEFTKDMNKFLVTNRSHYMAWNSDTEEIQVDPNIQKSGLSAESVQKLLGIFEERGSREGEEGEGDGSQKNLKKFIDALQYAKGSGSFHSLLPLVDAVEFILRRMEAAMKTQLS